MKLSIEEILGSVIEKPTHPLTATSTEDDLLSDKEVDIMLDAMHTLGASWEDVGTLFGFGIPGIRGCKWRGGFPAKAHVHDRLKVWNDLVTQRSPARLKQLFRLAKHHPRYAGYIVQSLRFDMTQDVDKLVHNFFRLSERESSRIMVPRSI